MPRTKKWYLKEFEERRVGIVRDGQEIKDKKGVSLGMIISVRRPSTRKTCEQANRLNFYESALQVSKSVYI